MSKCIEGGNRMANGYSRVRVNGKRVLAHRQAIIDEGSDIPSGMVVMHHCDNPACINVDHLSIATQLENVRDMWAKGRGHKGVKLTQEIADKVRAEPQYWGCQQLIADKYGITQSMVSLILSGKNW